MVFIDVDNPRLISFNKRCFQSANIRLLSPYYQDDGLEAFMKEEPRVILEFGEIHGRANQGRIYKQSLWEHSGCLKKRGVNAKEWESSEISCPLGVHQTHQGLKFSHTASDTLLPAYTSIPTFLLPLHSRRSLLLI